MAFNSIKVLENTLNDLKDAEKSKDLLKDILEIWDNSHEEYHYKAVASHQNSYHHKRMIEILENIREHLE